MPNRTKPPEGGGNKANTTPTGSPGDLKFRMQISPGVWLVGENDITGKPFVLILLQNTDVTYNGAVYTITPKQGPRYELDPQARTLSVVHTDRKRRRKCTHMLTLECALEEKGGAK